MIEPNWQVAAQRDLHVQLDSWRQLGGGDFAQSWQARVTASGENGTLAVGERVFVKTHANPPPFHFSTEARGLSWLREAGSVNVPEVLGVSDEPPYLALEWIDEAGRSDAGEVVFGASLAELHKAECTHFGRLDERSTGSLGLPNQPFTHWREFFASQRLLPLARIARDRQALRADAIGKLETLATKLAEFVELDVAPSRLHGDLWAGNRLVDRQGKSWLIDPASHGGHREFDLAMMRLFGGYGEACFSAYQESFPLHDGWQERVALHQLPPLVVHAIKFGSAYVGPTEDALAQYV